MRDFQSEVKIDERSKVQRTAQPDAAETKKGRGIPSLSESLFYGKLTDEQVMVACAVRQDGRVDDFTAGATLPCIISAYKIKVLLCVHPAFTLGAFHGGTSLNNLFDIKLVFNG